MIPETKRLPIPPLRRDAEAQLRERGVSGPALELLAGLAARARHDWRVHRTVVEALRYVGHPAPETRAAQMLGYTYEVLEADVADDTYDAPAMGVIAADLVGIGGPRYDTEGCATARVLDQLGAGRWQARDGEAWRGAADSAVLLVAGGGQVLHIRPHRRGHLLARLGRSGRWRSVPVPAAWRESILRRGMLYLYDAKLAGAGSPWRLVVASGSLAAWGSAWARASAAAEAEGV